MSFNFYKMKNVNFIFLLYSFILLSFLTSCQEEPELATVITSPVQNIAYISAVSGGYISDDGGADVTARGVVWNSSPNPTTSNNSTIDGSSSGSFTSFLTSLSFNTTYFVRAYAINSVGTAYGNQQSFTTANIDSGVVSIPGAGVSYNGYTYSSVVIGNGQEWMAENLQTDKYRNGDPIPTGLDNATWQATTTGACAIYNNDAVNYSIYGKLYNWFAVSDPRHVCPSGWHEPTNAEWNSLADYLGGTSEAGGKMKTTGLQYWNSPNLDATNESGFSGMPSGRRGFIGGSFGGSIGNSSRWWSASDAGPLDAYYYGVGYNFGYLDNYYESIQCGYPVRCLKD
jgi:uncharacterized protein (TIGR02145 family)